MKGCTVYILAVTLIGFSACKPYTQVNSDPSNKSSRAQIVFASYLATKMADNSCKIELIESHLITGQIKNNPKTVFLYPVNIELTNGLGNPLFQMQIEHPLVEDYEFANDKGELQRMIRIRDSARFYLRFNSLPEMENISFLSSDHSSPAIHSILKLKK